VAEKHVAEREREALRDEVQEVTRVVVMDVGQGEGALAPVHGHDVLVGGVAPALGQAGPRGTLLPLADAESETRGLTEHGLRRLPGALSADVAEAQRDRPPDRHRAASR